jgi:hypothetical protein
LKIPENDVMALEASDRLIDIIGVIGGVPVDVFQDLPSNSGPLLDIMEKSKEIN